ncbi:hypothetical protein [Delftia sp. Cs1-4]|uniref:hypothetical protein n=1 Tax=Delftia sp. (strain Cs1-4) TaxID=742013 RepID=UPI00155B3D2B|nr:hypothetical protein [Delftia sp. Cs1-4]
MSKSEQFRSMREKFEEDPALPRSDLGPFDKAHQSGRTVHGVQRRSIDAVDGPGPATDEFIAFDTPDFVSVPIKHSPRASCNHGLTRQLPVPK